MTPFTDTDPLPQVVGDDEDHDDEVVLPWWQNPVNILVMLVTAALLAGMIGWLVGQSSNDVATSEVDVGFLQDMGLHHEQAVVMSGIFLSRPDIDDQLVPVAQEIQFGQSTDIGIMIQLLRDMHAPTEGEDGQAMAWMGMPTDYADMPGMATDAELDELRNASGADADALFIRLMIAHHQGGIEMADDAAARAKNSDVRRYAQAWASGQAEEIAELQGLEA